MANLYITRAILLLLQIRESIAFSIKKMLPPSYMLKALPVFCLIVPLASAAFQYVDSSCAQFDQYGGIQSGVDESIRALSAAITALRQDHSLPQNSRIKNMLIAMFGQPPSADEAQNIVDGLRGEFNVQV